MYLRNTHLTIGKPHTSQTLQLAPSPFTKLAPNPHNVAYTTPHRDDRNVIDLPHNVDVHDSAYRTQEPTSSQQKKANGVESSCDPVDMSEGRQLDVISFNVRVGHPMGGIITYEKS
jgi:hypothetical protein